MTDKFEGFNFDGFLSSEDMGILVEHVNKPLAPAIANSRQSVPGMYGDINLGNAYSNKVFNITCTFNAYDDDDAYNEYVHNLAAYLIRRPGDGSEYPLIFGDEPDVTYYGIFTSIPEASQLVVASNDSKFELVFTCSDPKGYLPQQTLAVNAEPFTFTPDGTGDTFPVYKIIPKSDVYEAAVAYSTNPTGYIDIGSQLDPTEEGSVVDTNPVLVNDPCNTLATWNGITTPPFTISKDIDGAFESNDTCIHVKWNTTNKVYEYGDNTKHKSWFGPFLMHENLTDSVHNFKLSFRLHHIKHYSRGISKTELYLVDENNKCVGRIYIQDVAHGAASIMALYLGDEGHETKVFDGEWGKVTNGKNTTDKVTVVKKKETVTKTGTGSSSKSKTTVTYPKVVEKIDNYNNSDIFNNALIQFDIQKVGTTCYVTVREVTDSGTALGKVIINNKKVTINRDFALLTVAYYAAMYPITEDSANGQTGKPNKVYNYGYNSITNYKVSQVIDNSTDAAVIIAHAGDTIILNSENKHAYLATNGGVTSLDQFVSFGSSFPSIKGGEETTIGISPGAGEADITLTYRPTYE